MALTIAHHTGREQFAWEDIVEAMTTVESGTAVNIEYIARRDAAPSRSTRPATRPAATCT